jgi:hypothetical protein
MLCDLLNTPEKVLLLTRGAPCLSIFGFPI